MSKKSKPQSEVDDLFKSIYGYVPNKCGTAYELLVAAALKHIKHSAQVQSNQYVAGTYSKEKYQLDAVIDSITFVEAKDYTEQKQKVGRPDVTKLAGALQDLPQSKGIVASATDFTRPAIKYAESTKANPVAKEIDLYHIRPSSILDEQGRIKKIVIKMHIFISDWQRAKWEPIFTKEGADLLRQQFNEGDKIELKTEAFYRKDGSEIISAYELTSKIGVTDWDKKISIGSWKSTEPAHLKVNALLVSISELKYEIPYNVWEQEVIIEADGKACLLIRSHDGSIDKLLTDVDLKKTKFDDDGNVTIEE